MYTQDGHEFKVIGQSPEAVDRVWSGTGWTDKTSKGYPHDEAENIAHEVNSEGAGWIAWTEPK